MMRKKVRHLQMQDHGVVRILRRTRPRAVCCVALLLAWCASAQDAQPATPAAAAPATSQEASDSDAASLAKAAQNPVSSVISVPFQYNLNLNAERYYLEHKGPLIERALRSRLEGDQGSDGALRLRYQGRVFKALTPFVEEEDRTQQVLNIQPVYPVAVGKVNLINRATLPVIYQPLGEDDGEFGLGDLSYTMFLSPAEAGKVIWGIGPKFSFPTATDDSLGTGKWSAGPSAVVLTMPGRWVLGALVSNIWSFAGDDDRPDVNAMSIQPFINYNFEKGWYFSSSPIITADWTADSNERWTVPVGGGIGKIFKIGNQPMNAQLGAYYNVEKPNGAEDWNIRFQLQFMFPK